MPLDDAGFDWKKPQYSPIYAERAARLEKLRALPDEEREQEIRLLKRFYRDHPWQFIDDWGVTFDPRNVERGIPSLVPFKLFPKQIEWLKWVVDHWKHQRSGLTEKSRECGASWLAISLACTLCLFYEGVSIGFGSRLAEYVDKIGEPKSLFYKARLFMQYLPVEFRGGWIAGRDAPHMRMYFPETGSTIGGEGGDNIGRGDRRSIYFVDEAAHLEHPELVDAALSMTTNCRMDISSVNGPANPFAEKRRSGNIDVFTFHWRDDPRKDQAWYDKKVLEINNPVIVAQEIDIDYSASIEGVMIPSAWIQAAVDAHKKLVFAPTGIRHGALDVADQGRDLCAFGSRHGVLVNLIEEWSGKQGDTFHTAQKAVDLCDEHDLDEFWYDADGLGAYVRGDIRIINEQRRAGRRKIKAEAFRGSAGVINPQGQDVRGRFNEDYFLNLKAQAWWSLRTRFLKTYRFVVDKMPCNFDEIISLDSSLKLLSKLMIELGQPTYGQNGAGKIVVNKMPDNTKSPNLADVVMILFAPKEPRVVVSPAVLARSRQR